MAEFALMFVNLLKHRLYVRIKLDLTPEAVARIRRKLLDSVSYCAAICLYLFMNASLISLLGFKLTCSQDLLQGLSVGEKILCSELPVAIYFVPRFNIVATLASLVFACMGIVGCVVCKCNVQKPKAAHVRTGSGSFIASSCGYSAPYYKLHSQFLC